jgi:hyperosmotically inducible protein
MGQMNQPMARLERSDEVIKTNVVDHLYWDNRVDASAIMVTVNDGKVTLSGEVPSYSASLAAEGDASSVMGVTEVLNQLTVNYPGKLADEELAANIESKLFLNPHLLSYKFDVSIDKGWVTLEGIVDAFWKKVEAENEAASVRGVIGVTNKIAVVTTKDEAEKRVDEAVAEDIVSAITRNRKVNINDVNVKVKDGDVILTGTVPTWEARAAAYQSAIYTFGVANVDNNLGSWVKQVRTNES